jgi:putative FmdB family regulatory protein
MPIHEYQCSACGQRFEKLQKHNDSPLTECPACKESALTRLISAAAFRLKGSGWYETDFKTGGKRNLIGDPSGPPPSTDSDAAANSTPAVTDKAPAKSEKKGEDDSKKAAATIPAKSSSH